MSILTVGSSPGRGMRLNLPIAIVLLRRTDNRRGHLVPTVTELIFVRAQRFTNDPVIVQQSVIALVAQLVKRCALTLALAVASKTITLLVQNIRHTHMCKQVSLLRFTLHHMFTFQYNCVPYRTKLI